MVNTSILKPSGTGFEWCINQYDGCSHGCKYCYGMTIRRKKYEDWIKPRLRKEVVEKLKKDIQKLTDVDELDNVKDIFLGSICDSYQPIDSKYRLTRQIIQVLIEHDLPFTVLTKNGLVLSDLDLFKDYAKCRVGVTITSFDEAFRRYMEPGTASYDERIEVLRLLRSNKISTYLSCEPILPVREVDPIAITHSLKDIVDLFEYGMWNKYRYKHINDYFYREYSEKYYIGKFEQIISYCEKENVNYCIASHSREFCEKHGLPFKPYPLLKDSLKIN